MVRRAIAAVVLVSLVGVLAPGGHAAAGAATEAAEAGPAPTDALTAAVAWLETTQQPDGGFDGDGSGWATADVILALAESAQTATTWARRPAIDRVEAQTAPSGRDPLDAAADLARDTDDPGVVGRLLLDVALPLGLEAGENGPFGDLLGRAGRLVGLDDLDLDDRLDLALGLLAAGQPLPEGVIDRVLDAQQDDGGWNATGDPARRVIDLATTGAAVSLLVLAGAAPQTGPVGAGMAFVADTRHPAGWWPDATGRPSAAATAGAVLALRAAGYDPAGSCWSGGGVTSPLDALIALQERSGRFPGPAAVRTAAQAVHALSGNWLPRASAPDPCAPEQGGFGVDPALIVLAALALVAVGGGIKIMRSAPSSY